MDTTLRTVYTWFVLTLQSVSAAAAGCWWSSADAAGLSGRRPGAGVCGLLICSRPTHIHTTATKGQLPSIHPASHPGDYNAKILCARHTDDVQLRPTMLKTLW